MDGPRPLEALWFELRDKILAGHPLLDADMLEIMRATFYAGACAATLNGAQHGPAIHEELEEFSRSRRRA